MEDMMQGGDIRQLYERYARAFDKDRFRGLFEKEWLDWFRALIPPGGSVLDLGCGMGEPIARYLIEAGYALTGVDSSPSMIAGIATFSDQCRDSDVSGR